jgi:hypothetical protein
MQGQKTASVDAARAIPEDRFRQIVVKIAWERQFGGTDRWCRDSVVARGHDSRRMLHAEVFVRPVAMIALTSEQPHPLTLVLLFWSERRANRRRWIHRLPKWQRPSGSRFGRKTFRSERNLHQE